MQTRTYKVFAVTEQQAFQRAVAKDRLTPHRGDYRGRRIHPLKRNAKGILTLWEVSLT